VYEKFFINNVEFVSTIEKLIWGVAFFFPVRFGENELKISALNSGLECFTSLNDFILLKIALLHKLKKIELPKTVPAEMIEKLSHFPPSNVSIASALTTIEHTEVVAEILVTQVSEKYSQLKNFKWIIIAMIELTKFYLRLKLLIINGGHILAHRKIPNRIVDEQEASFQGKKENNPQYENRPTLLTFIRKMRHLFESNRFLDSNPTEADLYIIIGEFLWITRPLVYLFLLYLYGPNSFWPWIISFLFDISALRNVSNKKLNKAETVEIGKRKLQLLLYLLKSPVYDLLSENENVIKLRKLTEKIPIIGNLLPVVMDVLKLYNSRYFYTAGSK